MTVSVPKSLRGPDERAERLALLRLPHVQPLTSFVHRLREAKGPDYEIPYFDPKDGGVDATVLFLLEAPGGRAVAAGFVSRDNPDETAKNFFELNAEAGINRLATITWNAVPWYLGSGTKIRPAKPSDVLDARAWLAELMRLLPRLEWVVYVGRKALHARACIEDARPNLKALEMPHPSPMFVNRAPGNRERVLVQLRWLATRLAAAADHP